MVSVHLVRPDLVVEGEVEVDAAARWRHPARLHRTRPDLTPADITPFDP
ncbi:ATP-dependent DNA ligase [Streptomyces ardesiacus]|nr:ATP-dependent DNA ligase [Streptomyces ardesiacus]